MKAILLPTDFSKNSMNAIEYAVSLFEDETCEFYVLNIQKASAFVSDDFMASRKDLPIQERTFFDK